jgi:DnaJ-domain-containing protein 1
MRADPTGLASHAAGRCLGGATCLAKAQKCGATYCFRLQLSADSCSPGVRLLTISVGRKGPRECLCGSCAWGGVPSMRDLYKVLGVNPKADEARMKSAFRDRAKSLHPDLNSGDADAEQRFKELNQAYETLSDPKARAAYELGMADERARALRHMRSVTITMFVISMFSTVTIFGALIWLLAVAQRESLADRSAPHPKDVASWSREAPEKEPRAAEASGAGIDESVPKQAAQQTGVVARAAIAKDGQPPIALPDQKSAAPLAAPASLSPCGAHVVEDEPGLLGMALVDQARAGTSIIVRVGDLDYRAGFATDGRLRLVVPTLSAAPVFQWARADGAPCGHTSATALSPRLSIALVWAGYAGLEMHVVEPNSWLGSPIGHISSARPNLEGAYGAGRFRTFGGPGDSTRIQLFVVDTAKLGDRRFLNAVVALDGAGTEHCAVVGQTAEVRYQIYIYQSGRPSDALNPEVRSMAFEVPRCGEPGGARVRSENILVKF